MSDYKVEVRQSNIHGRGVFAKEDIKENEVLCFYDGAKYYVEANYKSKKDMPYYEYLYATDKYEIHGFKNPKHPNGIAQLINDGSIMNNTNNLLVDIAKYQLNSIKNCNVEFYEKNKNIYVRSLKTIKKDEELLVSYGYTYWLTHLDIDIEECCKVDCIVQDAMMRNAKFSKKEFSKTRNINDVINKSYNNTWLFIIANRNKFKPVKIGKESYLITYDPPLFPYFN
jgi:SET domain-containing protein